jgi:transcription elongation GreA/GreB family factor
MTPLAPRSATEPGAERMPIDGALAPSKAETTGTLEEVVSAELSTQLNRQLDHLVEELTERIPERLGQAQAQASYTELVERQRAIRRRIEYLRRVSAGLSIAAPGAVVQGQVGLGSHVRVEDLHSGEILSYTLMPAEDLDLDAGEISLASPVAQALLGKREGEDVDVTTPHRTRRFRVLSTTTLFDVLGVPKAPTLECA